MIKETTCKKLITRLISQKEFSKAEIILSRLSDENVHLETVERILEEMLKTSNYDEAFEFINNNLKGNELIFHILQILLHQQNYDEAFKYIKHNLKGNELTLNLILILKHQQEHSNPVNFEILNISKKLLSEIEDSSVKSHALLAEILFCNNEIEPANQQNELALNVWQNGSMEFVDLSYIISSLKVQKQINKANEILNSLLEDVNCGDDYIAESYLKDKINRLKYTLKVDSEELGCEDLEVDELGFEDYIFDVTSSEDDKSLQFSEDAFKDQLFNLHKVKVNALQFILRPRFKKISDDFKLNGTHYPDTLFDNLDKYQKMDIKGLKNDLDSLRSQLKSAAFSFIAQKKTNSQDIIDILSDYCTLSQVFFIKKEFKISENILSHALSIAMNQTDSHHPSTLNFSAGPKYECLYLVCYHYLIQGKIDSVNTILAEMEYTYSSSNDRFNLYTLCDDTLSWFSSNETFKTEILKYLYDKLFDKFNSSISLINVKYAVLIIQANDSYSQKYYVIQKLNELVNRLSNMALQIELKETCMIEVIKGLLKFNCLDTVIEILQTSDFSEKKSEEIYERLANYYFRNEPNLITLISRMKEHGKLLPDMNLKNIIDESKLIVLSTELVTPVITLFADSPENVEVILNQYSLNK